MKIKLAMAVMGFVIGTAGCVLQKPLALVPPMPDVPMALVEGQVMVECRLVQGGRALTAPKIITLSGREAQIFVGQEQTVAGAVKPVETGIKLTILPVLKGGRVSFTGSCSLKEKWNSIGDVRTTSTSFVTREAIFSGTAASGEEAFLFLPGNINGDESVEVTLKFTLVGTLKNDSLIPTDTTYQPLSPKQATEIQKEMVLVALKELLKTTREELLQKDLGVNEKTELRDNLESIRGRIDLWSR